MDDGIAQSGRTS
jgi:hypothetical protein